jgi:phenylacetate-CoA ligase
MTDFKKILDSFKFASTKVAYYKNILADRNIDPNSVVDIESFTEIVPVLEKRDIFPKFNADSLFTADQFNDFVSAIVSSGTSGVFSYGLVTKSSAATQSQMLDQMISQFFSTSPDKKTVVINALPMGVSFTSSHPVVPVSTRTDIALHVIKTLGKTRQIIIITEPRLLRRLVEEGEVEGIVWGEYSVSAVIGGMWFPESLTEYLVNKLNSGKNNQSELPSNQVLTTMGITEVGLNLFTGTPDLVNLRSVLQKDLALSKSLFSTEIATPVLGYALTDNLYHEIINQDEYGVGELVVTHLDTSSAPLLIRYNTHDKVKLLTEEELLKINFTPIVAAPIFAIYERNHGETDSKLQLDDIQQIYYQTPELVESGTDNFRLDYTDGVITVFYQLKPQYNTHDDVEKNGILFKAVSYYDYKSNMGLQYDYKWKH